MFGKKLPSPPKKQLYSAALSPGSCLQAPGSMDGVIIAIWSLKSDHKKRHFRPKIYILKKKKSAFRSWCTKILKAWLSRWWHLKTKTWVCSMTNFDPINSNKARVYFNPNISHKFFVFTLCCSRQHWLLEQKVKPTRSQRCCICLLTCWAACGFVGY